MKTVTFLLLRGLPASGKSTYADQLVQKGWKRLNKDMMREMIDGGEYSVSNEAGLNHSLYQMAELYLSLGYNVVSDNMNFNPWHFSKAKDLKDRIESNAYPAVKVEIKVMDFYTDTQTCIDRDAKRPKPVTEPEIRFIYDKWVKNGEFPDVKLFVDEAKVFEESADKDS